MFIKLTRFDNRPVWLNAAFIVTIEPRKDGIGSVIVPIGDGFDYDVRESVAEILGKLDGAPAATVVPVPAPDCLTKAAADVSPEPDPKREVQPAEPRSAQKASEPKPTTAERKTRKRTSRAKAKTEKAEVSEGQKTAGEPAAGKPAEQAAEKKTPPPLELSGDQVVRLVKLAPKSVAKLKNTLATQFHVADVGATVLALEAKGAFSLDGNHVLWPAVEKS